MPKANSWKSPTQGLGLAHGEIKGRGIKFLFLNKTKGKTLAVLRQGVGHSSGYNTHFRPPGQDSGQERGKTRAWAWQDREKTGA